MNALDAVIECTVEDICKHIPIGDDHIGNLRACLRKNFGPYSQPRTYSHQKLVDALEEISLGRGGFSLDPLEHANNCIEHMKAVARSAMEPSL